MKRVLSVAAILAMLMPAPVGAADPSPKNDSITRATRISSLPFAETVDVKRATRDESDPPCRNAAHTVWFKFTPDADTRLIARVRARRIAESVSVWSGEPGALNEIECGDYQPIFEATAGTKYYFMVGTNQNRRPGKIRFRLAEAPPPPSLTITVAPEATVDSATEAVTVKGTIACLNTEYAYYYGSARQAFDERQFITAWIDEYDLECDETPREWSTTVLGDGIFIDGPGFVGLETYACSRFECVEDTEILAVTFRRE